MAADPLRAIYDALERVGADPHGPDHNFRARCPGHDGDNREALHVSIGADGRALLWCFRSCTTETILAALDLGWADLFPPGHRHARPMRSIAKPRRPLDLVLQALRELGIDYRPTRDPGLWVAERCPACGAEGRYPLWVQEEDEDRHLNRVRLSCFNGCEQIDVLDALIGAK